jgi:hypothetical protein
VSRKKAVAGGLGVVSAMIVAGPVLAPAASATEPGGSDVNSAYAISAAGLLKINPTPKVDDSEGFSQQSLAELKLPASLLDLKLLNARAGAGRARASVADLSVGLGLGKPVLKATAIEAQCGHGKTSSSLAKAKIGDVKLDVSVPANTAVKVPGLVSVLLNKQTTHKDGSVTVTAISINVDGIQKIDIASATCAASDGGDDDGDGDGEGTPPSEPTSSSKPTSTSNTAAKPTSTSNGDGSGQAGDKPLPNGKAPSPKPVKAHLDVTG